MTGQTCALPGCFKPPWPSLRQGDSPALTCGNLHHQLLMASRFNPALPHPHQAILDRNAVGLCALRSCEETPRLANPWCSEKHYLSWLTEFTSSLQADQICILPGCTRHVFVNDINALPSRFCGWWHTQKFVMLSARKHSQEGRLPSVEVISPQPTAPSPASLNESEDGGLPSLNSLMHAFNQFVHFGITPKNSRVVEDFYEKHPWEVLTEGQSCWIIACPKFTIKKSRQWTTEGGHRWWRSGQSRKKSGCTVKYYKYIKRKGNEKETDQQPVESSYTMQEYTLAGIETHTLIHLVKKKLFSKGECSKEQPCKHPVADQVENIACSVEGPVTFSSSDYDMLFDMLLSEPPPLDEDLQHYSSCADLCGSCPNGSVAYN